MNTWRELAHSPAQPHQHHKLELPRAWEPKGSSKPSHPSEGKGPRPLIPHGNEVGR